MTRPNSPLCRPSISGGSGMGHSSRQSAAASKMALAPSTARCCQDWRAMSRWRLALTPPVRSHCKRRTLRRREDEGSSSRPCCIAARSRSASTTSSEARARSASGISVQAPAPRMSVLREAAGARLRRAESMSAADCSRCCGLCWRSHSRRCAPCVWMLLYVRLSMRTAAPPLVASRPLVAGVVGGTLLQESGDALAVVCRLDGDILQRALQPQGGFQVALDGRVHQFFDEAIGAGRPLCQPLRQRLRGLLKLIQRHAFVDQPDAFGLRPAHFLGQHRQFQRLAEADQTRQEEAATGIGDEADAGKSFQEAGVIGGDTQIAGQRKIARRASRDAAHGSNNRFGHGANRLDHPMISVQVFADLERLATGMHLSEAAQVLTRAKGSLGAGKHNAAHALIAGGSLNGLVQLIKHDIIEGVQHIGAVHGDGQHAAILGNKQGFIDRFHGSTSFFAIHYSLSRNCYFIEGTSSISTSRATRALTFWSKASRVRRMARTMRSHSADPSLAACVFKRSRISTLTVRSRHLLAASTRSRHQSSQSSSRERAFSESPLRRCTISKRWTLLAAG